MRHESTLVTPSDAIGTSPTFAVKEHHRSHLCAHHHALTVFRDLGQIRDNPPCRLNDFARLKFAQHRIKSSDRVGKRNPSHVRDTAFSHIQYCAFNERSPYIDPNQRQRKSSISPICSGGGFNVSEIGLPAEGLSGVPGVLPRIEAHGILIEQGLCEYRSAKFRLRPFWGFQLIALRILAGIKLAP
jgi:hypothetical protein